MNKNITEMYAEMGSTFHLKVAAVLYSVTGKDPVTSNEKHFSIQDLHRLSGTMLSRHDYKPSNVTEVSPYHTQVDSLFGKFFALPSAPTDPLETIRHSYWKFTFFVQVPSLCLFYYWFIQQFQSTIWKGVIRASECSCITSSPWSEGCRFDNSMWTWNKGVWL